MQYRRCRCPFSYGSQHVTLTGSVGDVLHYCCPGPAYYMVQKIHNRPAVHVYKALGLIDLELRQFLFY